VAEYLAPGVYVEEVSTTRSIEGVSTSTTGFVGSARRGPWSPDSDHLDRPELITSYGDFERIYGGFADLATGTNYLAHAVQAYFDNGGSRLYVSRAFEPNSDTDTGCSSSARIVDGADDTLRAYFLSRFPGAAGNGKITAVLTPALANIRSMGNAKDGTMLRTGAKGAAAPGSLPSTGAPPFSVQSGAKLYLTVNGTDVDMTFVGVSPEAFGVDPMADPVTLADGNLQVVVDGATQTIVLPTTQTSAADIVALVNSGLRGAHARLSTAADGGQNGRLVIGSDTWGTDGSVTIKKDGAGAGLGVTSDQSNDPAKNTSNTKNIAKVDAADINNVMTQAHIAATASVVGGKLLIVTNNVGAGAKIAVRDGANSAHAAFGLKVGPGTDGSAGPTVAYYVKTGSQWLDSSKTALDTSVWPVGGVPDGGAEFLTMTIVAVDADQHQKIFPELGFDARHPRYIGSVLAEEPTRRVDAVENLFALHVGSAVTPFQLRAGLFPSGSPNDIPLTGGNDGVPPPASAYKVALQALEQIEDISIVAAPGHSSDSVNFQAIQQELVIHVEPTHRAYRIAVLDPPPDQALSEVQTVRSRVDSTHAALYYPWVIVSNPLARPSDETIPREIALPPSGFVCGIYARSDDLRGVYKAPANEIIRGALRFESEINFAQQEVLNPVGINCLRYLTGRGNRVWGARNASSDPEWKYVNVRRYFNYVERSIDVGTQWAVFEPNGELLWASIRETVSSFLFNEWRSGALLGADPKEAFFVKCDRSTMTQNDLDNGRLICVIGIAVLKPAEFVIFRIGQKTADSNA
jgi:phage tail sheath protein FI